MGNPAILAIGRLFWPQPRHGVLTPSTVRLRHTALAVTRPYHTHQVIELPAIQMDVTHCVLHEAWCPVCAQWTKAQLPPEHTAGYGPRLTALIGEIAGTHGTGRRTSRPFVPRSSRSR